MPIPTLLDLVRDWLTDERFTFELDRVSDKIHMIKQVESGVSVGYVILDNQPSIVLFNSRNGVIGSTIRPEDPEFFEKLKHAIERQLGTRSD